MTRFVTMFWATSLSVILGLAVPGLAQNTEKAGPESTEVAVLALH